MDFQEGTYYGDFTVTKHLPLEELQSTLIELVHEPSGARIMHIANDDEENLFSILLQTLPSDSTGVAHILEHTVLCGSKKFPVKDPFFSMTRRSLNTFMNAMTGQDFTCYPASSQIEKDFYNLFEVYLDAVFHPELKKLSFLQEGHRLAFEKPTDPKSTLQFQGVVYNEMKGDRSSAESRFWDAIYPQLTPDLTYAHNSGGDPKHIPDLSYEELKEFHNTFYHPSRALFFFYGNLPLKKHLDFLQEHLLTGVKKLSLIPPLPKQPRFSEPRIKEESFPASPDESLEKKSLIGFSWLTVSSSEQLSLLTLALLEQLLLGTDAAPLKKELLKSGLCSQVTSSLDPEMSEIPWTILCKGCDPQDAEKLQKLLLQVLKNLTSKSFPIQEVKAALHQLEFERTEIGAEGIPFGLTLFLRAATIKQHGSQGEDALQIHTLFQELDTLIKNRSYLPKFLKKHLIDNPHFVRLTLKPDPSLTEKEESEEKRRLDELKKSLTQQEIDTIIQTSKELKTYQETNESDALKMLPKLALSDVNPKAKELSLEKTSHSFGTSFRHLCFTNQILYADLLFDLPHIPKEDLTAASFFTQVLTEVGCKGASYEKTLGRIQEKTGGIGAALSLYPSFEDPSKLSPTFSLQGKALHRNASDLFALFSDFLSSANLTDIPRLQELFDQQRIFLENRLPKAAMQYAIQSSLSGFSLSGLLYHQWSGFGYYQSMQAFAQNPERLFNKLPSLQQTLLNHQTPHLVCSLEEKMWDTLPLSSLQLSTETKTPFDPQAYELQPLESHVRFIPAPVAFTSMGMSTIFVSHKEASYLLIASQLLEDCILHTEIREKGGAYGARAVYLPSSGLFYLYSYRDPNLASTLITFKKALESLSQGHFTEEQLEEAKFGCLQSLDAPIAPESKAATAYNWMRRDYPFEMRNTLREKLLQATKKEVASAIKEHLVPQKKVTVSFLGEHLFEQEKEKLPYPLTVLPTKVV